MYTLHFFVTVLVLVLAIATVVRMVIVEKRPRTDLKPRLIPTTPVMIVSAFVAILALIHLMNLIGIHTGRR